MPRRTQGLPRLPPRLRIREFHPLRCAFPCASPVMSHRLPRQPYNPIILMVWAPPLSARHYLRNRSYFPSPAGTEMFQFPAYRLDSCVDATLVDGGVPPFGHRRVVACLLLAVAFRRLLRPSSPPGGQASAIRSSSLNLKCSLLVLS